MHGVLTSVSNLEYLVVVQILLSYYSWHPLPIITKDAGGYVWWPQDT